MDESAILTRLETDLVPGPKMPAAEGAPRAAAADDTAWLRLLVEATEGEVWVLEEVVTATAEAEAAPDLRLATAAKVSKRLEAASEAEVRLGSLALMGPGGADEEAAVLAEFFLSSALCCSLVVVLEVDASGAGRPRSRFLDGCMDEEEEVVTAAAPEGSSLQEKSK